MVRRSARILRQSFGTVRSAAFRRSALSLLKTCSIGLRSGEYGVRRTHSLDRVRHTGYLMSRKVVHDDDVTAVERWSQTLFDVCEEDCPVHRPIDHEGCDHPVVAQSDNQGDGLPMAVGNGPDQSFAPRATAPKSHQAGAGGGLVDKHQSGGIKQALLANPAPPCPRHVRPFLLRRAQAFFDGDIMSLEKSPDRSTTGLEFVACASPQRSRPRSDPVARLPEPTAIPRAPPTATCSRRSALLWRFLCHTSAATISPPNWRSG